MRWDCLKNERLLHQGAALHRWEWCLEGPQKIGMPWSCSCPGLGPCQWGQGLWSLPLVPLPAQGIQLQLTILEMDKYIDRQMYVLSNSPEGQQSHGDTQLGASSHFGSFSSSRTNRSHKGTIQGNTSFQPSKCLLSREIKWALFKYSQHFLPWK